MIRTLPDGCYTLRCVVLGSDFHCKEIGKVIETLNILFQIWLCVLYKQTQSYTCKLLDRSYGAVWTTSSPPSGPLSIRMLLSDENGDETWIVPVNDIPDNWKAGDIYDSGAQVIAWSKQSIVNCSSYCLDRWDVMLLGLQIDFIVLFLNRSKIISCQLIYVVFYKWVVELEGNVGSSKLVTNISFSHS